MGRYDLDPQGSFSDGHPPDAMDQPHRFHRIPSLQLVEQSVELVLGHGNETTIIDRRDELAPLLSANHSREIDRRSHASRHGAGRQKTRFIDRVVGDGKETLHPPWTGGNKETRSPALRTYSPS